MMDKIKYENNKPEAKAYSNEGEKIILNNDSNFIFSILENSDKTKEQ